MAALDADVLVPILTCDLLLTAFDEDLYRPVVTTVILGEVERNLLAAFPHLDPVALRGRVAQAADVLSRHTHDVGDIDTAELAAVNPKDRHVVPAAITNGANVIVTNDRRLRREVTAMDRGLVAVTADAFALQLFADHPDGIDEVITALVAKRIRRPVTRSELVDQLAGALPGFAGELRRRLS
ncbi:MAG: hypothetical protein ACRD0G_11865 [Acidimicrobiales bacterium]